MHIYWVLEYELGGEVTKTEDSTKDKDKLQWLARLVTPVN